MIKKTNDGYYKIYPNQYDRFFRIKSRKICSLSFEKDALAWLLDDYDEFKRSESFKEVDQFELHCVKLFISGNLCD